MLKRLLKELWECKLQVSVYIIAAILMLKFFCGNDSRTIEEKIIDWELNNYQITEWRKTLIIKQCTLYPDKTDFLIDSIAKCQAWKSK